MRSKPLHPTKLGAALAANAPAVFLIAVLITGVSILLGGVLAAEGSSTELHGSHIDVREETVTLSYPVPTYAPVDAVLDVAYTFPQAPGDVYLLSCAELEQLLRGDDPENPAVSQVDERSGSFTRSLDNYLGYGTFYFGRGDQADMGAGASGGAPTVTEACVGAFVTFQWTAPDPAQNRPDARVVVRETPLDSGTATALLAVAAVGAAMTLASGLHWSRKRSSAGAGGAIGGVGTAEALYVLARRAEDWLSRTRRYLLVAGVIGIFLWYPVLVPWAWRAGREASGSPLMPWLLTGAALVFLMGLTALWVREFTRLDNELMKWRHQLAELRRREEALLTELSV